MPKEIRFLFSTDGLEALHGQKSIRLFQQFFNKDKPFADIMRRLYEIV